MYVNFSSNGQNRVDVGESRGCEISPIGLPVTWASLEELHSLEVYVADAVGKLHKATFQGKQGLLSRMKTLGFSHK